MFYTREGDRRYTFNLLIAPRYSGKTIMLKDLLYHHRTAYAIIVYSESEDGNSHFQGIVPNAFIRREADEVMLAKDVYRQIQQVKENGKENAKELMFIFEDCAFNERFFNSPIMKFLAMNGRNFKITVFATIQFINSIKPFLKEQADYVMVFDMESRRCRDIIYEYWFNMFATKDIFSKHLFNYTRDYRAFIYEKGSRTFSGTNQYCFYHYRANKDLPPFVAGSLDYWRVGLSIEGGGGSGKLRDENFDTFMSRMISTQGKKTKTFKDTTGRGRKNGLGQRISIIE